MKILFLLDTIFTQNNNGGVQSLNLLLQKLDSKHKLTIFSYDRNYDKSLLPNSEFHIFSKPNLSSKYPKANFILNHAVNLWMNIKYIALGIKQKPDLIYCSGSLSILSTLILKNLLKTKVVHRIYGTFLSTTSSTFNMMKNYLEILLFKSRADKYIITNDGTMGDKVARHFGIPEEKIAFLKNGVNSPTINDDERKKTNMELRSNYGIPKTSKVFISTCRLAKWKRVDRIINTFNKLKDEDHYFIIIGGGPEEEKLKTLSEDNPRILFLGPLNHDDLEKHLIMADVYISTYDYSNLGNTLFEALAAGLPVLTIDTGATGDTVSESNKNGLLVKNWNDEKDLINKLSESILKISQDKELLATLSKGAYTYAKSNLTSWDDRIDQEIKILEGL